MPNTWITDMRDFLDGAMGLPELPGPARRIADYFGAIVIAMSDLLPETMVRTHVRCRRRPGRRPCAGRLEAVIDAESRIRWQCPACGDNGVLSGWQRTPWDMRRGGPPQ